MDNCNNSSDINNYCQNADKLCFTRIVSIMGPTGPSGPSGAMGASTVILGNYSSLEELKEANPTGHIGNSYIVGDDLYTWSVENNEWHNVGVIRGPKGDDGPTGPKGEKGETGPAGPKGNDGTSVTILGNYDTVEQLKRNHPKGIAGQSYLVGDNLYVWSDESDDWIDVGIIRGPQGVEGKTGPTGPKGEQGPKGDTGPKGEDAPINLPAALFLTTSEDLDNGTYIVEPDENFPLALKTMDTDSLFYINSDNNTITFFKKGIYRIDFSVIAHPTLPVSPQAGSNIISVGFKKVGESTVYAGISVRANNTDSVLVNGSGVINLTYDREWFELANLGKYSVIVESPSVDDLITESSLVTPAVSILIQKIG